MRNPLAAVSRWLSAAAASARSCLADADPEFVRDWALITIATLIAALFLFCGFVLDWNWVMDHIWSR